MSKFCRECGTQLNGRRFCTECGKEALISVNNMEISHNSSYEEPKKNKKRAGSVEIPDAAEGDEATSIYKRIIATVRGTHHGEYAENAVKDFKRDCKLYGAGSISPIEFEQHLRVYLGEYMMESMIPHLVRLIHDDDKRLALMEAYQNVSKSKARTRPASTSFTHHGHPPTDLTMPPPPPPDHFRSVSDGQAKSRWSAPSLYSNQPVCDICTIPFDMINRRHHCRKCGKSACQSCSPAHMLIPPGHQHEKAKGYDQSVPQRVCTLCAPILQPLQSRLEAVFANCHKDKSMTEAPASRGWFKSLPMKQTIEDECESARQMLRQFFITPQVDKQVPISFLERAHGLAFFTVVKAGLLLTAKMGSGIVVTKLPNDTWSAPSAIGTAGLGGGLEAGGELVKILIILGSAKAVSVFYETQITLGAGLDVAIGPYGRSAQAQAAMSRGKSLGMNYSYSHSKGLFAGISLHGSVINCRSDANRTFYGRLVSPSEILSGVVAPPRAAQPLYDAIDEAMQSCAEFREGQRLRENRSCSMLGCPCEKFRAKTLSSKCGNCGHQH